jgi:preprotein translocase subunit SecG
MLFTFLLVVQAIIAFALVSVILMQRSEGGGLGMGGSPSGLMSARGAADFLTRSTSILAAIFVLLSIVLAVLAATQHRDQAVDTSLVGSTSAAQPQTQPQDQGALGGAPATGNGADQSVPLQ